MNVPRCFDPVASESVTFAEAIRSRPDDPIFVTQGLKDAEALSESGLLGIARPYGGAWDRAALASLSDRSVVIVNTTPFGHRGEWCQRDRKTLSSVCRRAFIFVPVHFTLAANRVSSLAELLSLVGAEAFAEEARLTKEEPEEVMLPEHGTTDGLVAFIADPPNPRPIRVELPPVPIMTREMIPEPLRDWLADIAERVGCSIDFPVVGAILAVACLVGRKLGIRPKRHDDWLVIPNLWGAILGRPGLMKTPALEEALKPLNRLVAEARKRHALASEAHDAETLLAAAKAKAAKCALEKAARGGSEKTSDEKLSALASEAAALSKSATPILRRYMVNDTTIEKLGEIFSENPTGVLLFRDELTGFIKGMDKPGHESDRAAFLEAWNGNGHFTCDRIGRGTTYIDGACLSILGGIQPGPMAAYIRAAASGDGEANDGFISRFQVLVYPDPPKEWRNVDRWPDTEAKNRAFDVFRALDSLVPSDIGAEIEEEGSVPFLRFSPEAQDLFDEWRHDLENNKLLNNHEHPLIENHLAKYRRLMPSFALLFHLIDVVDGGGSGRVSRDSAELAAAWCDFLELHARRIYQSAFDSDPEPARRLSEQLLKGSVESPFRVRDVARRGWSGLGDTQTVERAVGVLEEHDWLYAVEQPSGSTGGRPTFDYYVNPRIGGSKS